MARALQADHDVCVLTTPAGESSVRAAGIESVTLLQGWDGALNAIADTPAAVKANPLRMLRQFSAAIEIHHQVQTELNDRYSRCKPDLLIADYTLIAAGPVAQSRGIRWWTSLPSPCVLDGGDGPPSYMGGLIPKSGWAGKLRDQAGWMLIHTFKKMTGALFHQDFRQLGITSIYRADGSETIYSSERILAIAWQELEFRQQWPEQVKFVSPFLYTPPSMSPDPIFQSGSKHILVTLGTHIQWAKAPVLAEAQALAADHPEWQIHFSEGDINGSHCSRIDNFHRHSFIDYTANIKKYDLVVHHGGAGIMNQCLANGVPAIVYPREYDQFDNAARLECAGLALRLRRLDLLGAIIHSSLADCKLKSRCLGFAAQNQDFSRNHQTLRSLI